MDMVMTIKNKIQANQGDHPEGIMNRVDGLSFRSNPDLLQRHKTSTNNNIYFFVFFKKIG